MYYSESLDIILEKYINEDTYGEISEVLKHIFQRRACEFEFSDEEMEQQIKSFCENCKSIELRFSRDFYCAGSYSNKEKKIELDNNPIHYVSIYKTLIHEVYHAIYPGGLLHYDFNDNRRVGIPLTEICVETAAMRTSTKKITSQNYLETSAYQTITPVINLIAVTTGVPEKQLLKAGLQGREEFMQVIYSKFPGDACNEEVKNLFKKIETNLEVIYNNMHTNEQIDKKVKIQIISSAFQGMEEAVFELAAYQMNLDEKSAPAEKAYRFKNMESIIEYIKKDNGIKFSSTNITQDKKNEILSIDGVQEALANPDHEYEKQKFHEEHGNKTNWRDILVQCKLYSILGQNMILSVFPKNVRNKIKSLINRKSQKLLGSGKADEEHNYKFAGALFRERYKVDLPQREETLPNDEKMVYTNPKDVVKDNTEEER